MYIWLMLALISASVEAIAVLKNLKNMEYIAKPAVMVWLFLWLYSGTGIRGEALWFGLGVLSSLLGDVLLMLPGDRMFLSGLVAFLFAHIFYIAGFRAGLNLTAVWSSILAVFILGGAGGFLRRLVIVMRDRGDKKLVLPVLLYAMVASVMLFAALSTLSSPVWRTGAAILVGVGAFLFCVSDALLAWNKFAAPMGSGRVISILLYHLGQMGIVAGVIGQFAGIRF